MMFLLKIPHFNCCLILAIFSNFFYGYSSEEESKSKVMLCNSLIPKELNLRERILTAIYCMDAETIPKQEKAGQIVSVEGNRYQLMHNGIKVIPDSYYGDWMTVLIQLLQGHHEPQEEKVFYDVLQSLPAEAVMIELGAFWGYYSLWLLKEIPHAKAYLIEPDDKNLLVGKAHFLCNNCVGDFTHAMIGSYSRENQPFINWEYATSYVKQICIDDFVKDKEIPFIHVLHSDIQGAEVDMLHGCKQLLQENKVGYFFISTHRGTHEKCLEALEDTEYDILLSITREESFAADGLIIAKSPKMKGPTLFNVTRRTKEVKEFISKVLNE